MTTIRRFEPTPIPNHPASGLMNRPLFLGIDIGSTTLKAVLLSADGELLHSLYRRTQPQSPAGSECAGKCQLCGRCNLGAVAKTLDDFLADAGVARDDVARTVATGSQVVDELLRFLHFDASVSEVSAHIAAATHYYPDCRAVLDVGGQDSKAMLFDDDMKIWVSKMSGICAAGTGAFLDSVAAKTERARRTVGRARELRFAAPAFVGLRRVERHLGQQVQESLSSGRRDCGRLPRPGQNDRLGRGRPVSRLRRTDRFPGRRGLESRRRPLPASDHRQPHPHPGTEPGDGSAGSGADRPRQLGAAMHAVRSWTPASRHAPRCPTAAHRAEVPSDRSRSRWPCALT